MNSTELEIIEYKIRKTLKSSERENNEILLEYMENNGFFEKPASTGHHENYKGGLMVHSFRVWNEFDPIVNRFNEIMIQSEKPDLCYPDDFSFICSIPHDGCKMLEYMKDKFNGWVRNPAYNKKHGSLSIDILRECGIPITKEEESIIRYHMGHFHTFEFSKYGEYSSEDLFKAMTDYPMVHFFQSSDYLASRWNDKFYDDFVPKI